ncbi:MAG: Ig-like domain-containing protein [Planctomycetota bacterium]
MFLKGLICGFIFIGGGVAYFSMQDTGRVTITIEGANDAPVATDDEFSTGQNVVLRGNLLANDSDPDEGDTLRVTQINGQPFTPGDPITLPSGAILTVQENGEFTYDPNGQFQGLPAGETGQSSFDYEVEDSRPQDPNVDGSL